MTEVSSINAWVGFFGVILGSLISTLGVWLNNLFHNKRLKIQLEYERNKNLSDERKRKLEDLYLTTKHWANAITGNALSLNAVMKGKLDYNQHMDLFIKSADKKAYDFNRIEMLLRIYAQEAIPLYNGAIAARTDMNKVEIEHKFAYENNLYDGEKFLKPFISKQIVFEKATEKLLDKILSLLKEA
jgi:hypothetical protein